MQLASWRIILVQKGGNKYLEVIMLENNKEDVVLICYHWKLVIVILVRSLGVET